MKGDFIMKKRISTLVCAAILTVAMVSNVFAYGSTSSSSAAEEAKTEASSSVSTPAPAPAPAAAPAAVFTTPTGQAITEALVAAYAASVTTNDGAVAPVSPITTIAVSNYLKAVMGNNAAIVANFTDLSGAGNKTITCPNIVAGMNYLVLVQFADGTVKFVKPTSIKNGKLKYKKPAGNVFSIAVVLDASSPK